MLTKETIPNEIDVLHFEPGKQLCIRVQLHIVTRISFLLFSLFLYLFFAKLCAYIFAAIVGFESIADLAALFLAIVLCIVVNRRGTVVEINFSPPRYKLTSPISNAKIPGLPELKVTTSPTQTGWMSKLLIDDYLIATRLSEDSAETAQHTFKAFIAQINPNDKLSDKTEVTLEQSVAHKPTICKPVDDTAHVTCEKARPLIVLVHGTWGSASKWAMPKESEFVRQLKSLLCSNKKNPSIEIDRFGWSGVNRASDRALAAHELANYLQDKLSTSDRLIFVIAHSHGGNIALRAHASLKDDRLQSSVRCILMATPFVTSGQRFNLWDIYHELPRALIANFFNILFWSFWIFSLCAAAKFEPLFRGIENSIILPFLLGNYLATGQDLPLLLIFFLGPPLLFSSIWSRGEKLINNLPQKDSTWHDRHDIENIIQHRIITSTQDEAYQVLSMVVNLLSFAHQLIFLFAYFLAQIIKRYNIFSSIWMIAESAFFLPFLFMVLGGIIFVFWSLIPSELTFVPSFDMLADAVFNSTFSIFFQVAVISFRFFFSIVAVCGAACLAFLASLVIIGIVRMVAFSVIGVIDQLDSKDKFVNGLFATVSVSTVPVGHAKTFTQRGLALFNHTKIYDDKEVISFIANQIDADLRDFPLH